MANIVAKNAKGTKLERKHYCQNHPKIEADIACRYCGKWYCEKCIPKAKGIAVCDKFGCMKASQTASFPVQAPNRAQPFVGADQAAVPSKYLYISLFQFSIMNILTLNFYSCYWLYMNWKYVKERDKLDISPLGRTIFLPFYCYSLFKQIHDDRELNKVQKAEFNTAVLAIFFIVLGVTPDILSVLKKIPGAWPNVTLIELCMDIPLFLFALPVQSYINQVNESLQPKPDYQGWTWGQTVFLILGLLAFFECISLILQGK